MTKHLLLLGLVLLVAACGSGEPGEDSAAPEPEDTSTIVGEPGTETSTTLPERVDPSPVTVPETTPPAVGEVPQDILDEISLAETEARPA